MQARIAVAGDHEGVGLVVLLDQPAQRHRNAVDVGLTLDPVRTLGQGYANDLRPVGKAKLLELGVEAAGHRRVRIGIDDEDARAGHDFFLAQSLVSTRPPRSDFRARMTQLRLSTYPPRGRTRVRHRDPRRKGRDRQRRVRRRRRDQRRDHRGGRPRPAGRQRDIDAKGKLVLPGGIDSHAHIEQLSANGKLNADTFESATTSAAFGGTTTVISFAAQHVGMALDRVVADYHALAERGAVIDYAFHMIIADPTETTLKDHVPKLVRDGHASIKVFMTYDRLKVDDEQLLDVLVAARENRPWSACHAENHGMISWMVKRAAGARLHRAEIPCRSSHAAPRRRKPSTV